MLCAGVGRLAPSMECKAHRAHCEARRGAERLAILRQHRTVRCTVRLPNHRFGAIIAKLRERGFIVSLYSAPNNTWQIKGEGMAVGRVASGAEMLELERADRLNVEGIKSLVR